jgi:hypothetical protein
MDELRTTMGELEGLGEHSMAPLRERLSEGIPSRPLLGFLPVRRLVPQDVHSALDYLGGATLTVAGLIGDGAAKAVGLSLGLGTIGLSLMTDYRLSLRKVVPIEVHEAGDYLVGLAALAAPFAFGYSKRNRAASWLHVAVGATVVLGSLFTDYRAQVGRGGMR